MKVQVHYNSDSNITIQELIEKLLLEYCKLEV